MKAADVAPTCFALGLFTPSLRLSCDQHCCFLPQHTSLPIVFLLLKSFPFDAPVTTLPYALSLRYLISVVPHDGGG